MEIVFATKNNGKLKEIVEILAPIQVRSMTDINIDIDVTEDGSTFEENAVKKATEIAALCGRIVLADDSGLEIDYLDKAPGVYSARYLGEDTPYAEKNRIVLEKLTGVPDAARTARFVCVIAAAFPDGRVETRRGVIEGIIADAPRGENGFGYDPIFYVPEYGVTTAEMSPEQKNKISHRGQALRLMKEVLDEAAGN